MKQQEQELVDHLIGIVDGSPEFDLEVTLSDPILLSIDDSIGKDSDSISRSDEHREEYNESVVSTFSINDQDASEIVASALMNHYHIVHGDQLP